MPTEEDKIMWLGNVGDPYKVRDNGLYTRGQFGKISVNFLIDTGSTATLIPRNVFDQADTQSNLVTSERKLFDVNGNEVDVHGSTHVNITINDITYNVPVIVCDISGDAILGQDFLLKNVKKIDYRKLSLITVDGDISCWIGGEAEMICRVQVAEKITIPPCTQVTIPVVIPNCKYLAETGLIEASFEHLTGKPMILLPGIIETQRDHLPVTVLNFGSTAQTLYPSMTIGTCESYYEAESHQISRSVTENSPQLDDKDPVPEYLMDLLVRSSTYLCEDEKHNLASLLKKYQKVFSCSSGDIGRTDRVRHKIDTGTARPIRQPPRRLPFGKREVEKAELEKMLDREVIEPSKSPWSSPIVLVSKKDGSTRFCVDYRRLNDVTLKDAYPLPRVDECLDSLAGAKWFSSMDLNSGFWQIAMSEDDKEKTAFSTSQGLYQFTVMPFGLTNSPSTFERLMEDVLRGLQWEICLLYMDDIVVPAESFKQTLTRLEFVFQRLLEANLKLKPSKCFFFQKKIQILGHLVSEYKLTLLNLK